MVSTTAIWPHELFAGLYEHHRQAFDKYVLGGGVEVIRQFWDTMPARPGLEGRQRWRTLCIPIAIHGDGVAVSNVRGKGSKSVDCLSWTSLLASGPSKFVMFFIWFCFGHQAKKQGYAQTWKVFWRKLQKSLRALFEGRWPATDMQDQPDPRGGTPLADGLFAVVYCSRGDLEWQARHFGLRHPASSLPCALCNCSNYGDHRDRMPWTDVNNEPTWLSSCLSDEDRGFVGIFSVDLLPCQKWHCNFALLN